MELTDERRHLRDAVRGLLAQQQRGDPGDDRALWRRLCGEIGVAGLAIPPRYGGAGAGPVETHIVMEELGRGLTCSPLLGSAVLAAPGSASPGSASPGSAALARARDLACIALSAEQVGAAQRALELTVAYTKVRVQFGRPIGSFQALQHRLAGLHVLGESARSLSYAAAEAAAEGAAGLGLHAAAAKVYCSEALARVAGEMIQMHGAIGITWEHDAHRYLKRAHGAGQLFGRPSEHAARVAAAVIDGYFPGAELPGAAPRVVGIRR